MQPPNERLGTHPILAFFVGGLESPTIPRGHPFSSTKSFDVYSFLFFSFAPCCSSSSCLEALTYFTILSHEKTSEKVGWNVLASSRKKKKEESPSQRGHEPRACVASKGKSRS